MLLNSLIGFGPGYCYYRDVEGTYKPDWMIALFNRLAVITVIMAVKPLLSDWLTMNIDNDYLGPCWV